MQTTLRPLLAADLPAASALVQRTFDRFEGPDYPAEGITTFHRFTDPDAMTQRLADGIMCIWGAYRGEELAGVLASRDGNHISLLFVDERLHRQGIARMLFAHFCNEVRTKADRITVNSSPFAVEVYLRLGFSPTSAEQTVDGIRFTPMEYTR